MEHTNMYLYILNIFDFAQATRNYVSGGSKFCLVGIFKTRDLCYASTCMSFFKALASKRSCFIDLTSFVASEGGIMQS